MEQLLEKATRAADQAEVFARDTESHEVLFENSRLKETSSRLLSGLALTVTRNGRLGYAYTRNLLDREELVQNALANLKSGPEFGYELPAVGTLPELDTYSDSVESVSVRDIASECLRICETLSGRTTGQVNVEARLRASHIQLLNSSGTRLSSRLSRYFCRVGILYPGTETAVERATDAKAFEPFPDPDLEYVLQTYNRSSREVRVPNGASRALFMAEAMPLLGWRLTEAVHGRAVYEKTSPLRDRIGQTVLDESVSMHDEPLCDARPGARSFDDEGTPCRNMPLFDKGELRNFYFDRYYAWKAGRRPTGHGYRYDINCRPSPSLRHLVMKPGESSFDELLELMGKGVVIAGTMGDSGNLLNGDYSFGLAPGLVVDNGQVVGRIKDAMVSGNVYDTMAHVIGVEDQTHLQWGDRFPAVLFESVALTTKT